MTRTSPQYRLAMYWSQDDFDQLERTMVDVVVFAGCFDYFAKLLLMIDL